MGKEAGELAAAPPFARRCPRPAPSRSPRRCASLRRRSRPLILAGGGAKRAETALRELAEKLGAPVVLTANARGLLHAHPLGVPASPSLKPVRALIDEADLVIAVGTEFGPTDYDMYADGGFVMPKNLVRIDIDAEQLARRPATLSIQADCGEALAAIAAALASSGRNDGAARAETTRKAALAEITPDMREQLAASRRSATRCPAPSSSAIRRSRSMPATSTTTTTVPAAGSMPRPATARSATARRRRSARPLPRLMRRSSA